MNLNRAQFLQAVENGQALLEELRGDYPELRLRAVFSRFGPRSGQCDLTTDLKRIIMKFPKMLEGEAVWLLRTRLFEIRRAKMGVEKIIVPALQKQVKKLKQELLSPDLALYCGDVLIEYRPEILKYESLRRLQQDSRLPPELNEVGSIRVVAGSLEFLANEDG